MDSDVEESPCDDADVDQCSICIEALGQNSSEDFDKDLAASACSCGHVFHTGCLRQWLRIKSWCPTCKTKQHLNSSGRQPNTITRLFLNFQGARAPSEDSSSRGLELPQEAVLGLKMQLVDAEAKIAAAEAAASAAAEREKSLAAEASQRERRAGNEEYYLKRRLGEVFQQLEGETLKRKQVESKLALGAYVNAMLAGTSTSVNRSDQRRSHSSSGGEGDSSDSGDAAGIRGRGAATTAPSSSSSSTTTNMQRQAALAAATRACSLDDVVAVQQRLLDKLRAGKVAAERKLAEALRSSATVTVVPSAGDVEEARSMKSEHGNARKASRGNNRDRTISSRRDSGKFRRVNPFLCEGSADANARSIALSQDAGDGEEGGEDDGDGEDDEEEDDFDVSVMSQEIESSGESNTTRAALAADRHDDSPQLEVPVAAGALKRKSAKQLKRLEADGALAMGENCVTINLVDDYTGGKRKSAKQVEWSEDTYLFDTDGLIDSVMGFTSGSIHDNHMLCKLCTYSNEPSAKECRMCGSALTTQVLQPDPARKRPRMDSSSSTLPRHSVTSKSSSLYSSLSTDAPSLKNRKGISCSSSSSSHGSRTSNSSSSSSSSATSSASDPSLSKPPPSAVEVEAKAFALYSAYGGPGAASQVQAKKGASAVPEWCAPTGGATEAIEHTLKRAWRALSHSKQRPWLDQAARKLARESEAARPLVVSRGFRGLPFSNHHLKKYFPM